MIRLRLISLLVCMAAMTVTPAMAQFLNLDEGKTPVQLFTSDCSVCHNAPNGLAKGRSARALRDFLRQHYTASKESAAAIAGFLAALPEPRGGRATRTLTTHNPAVEENEPTKRRRSSKQDATDKPAENAERTARRHPAEPAGEKKKEHPKETAARPDAAKPAAAKPEEPGKVDETPAAKPAEPESEPPKDVEQAKTTDDKPVKPVERVLGPAPKPEAPAGVSDGARRGLSAAANPAGATPATVTPAAGPASAGEPPALPSPKRVDNIAD